MSAILLAVLVKIGVVLTAKAREIAHKHGYIGVCKSAVRVTVCNNGALRVDL